MALGKHRDPPNRADSGVDSRHALNAKRGRKGDLRAKLVVKAAKAARSILTTRSKARIPRSIQMEQLLLRYQTFTPKIEGIESQEKFNPLKFTMENQIRGHTLVISDK